ncbi:hypothetical protein ACFFL1_07465 [Samsonia erythrinae]|uniref:Uncharacterized protein n=1 Tax=Samsonia erythrinae TaxID=160434 RepID=A0A4R3VMK3_9GAMM|nr:hypothetical protein [Samsonia erythrinae]TCV07795.1 hypothetical protein EDC54_102367 [Samsonia erythrinae]
MANFLKMDVFERFTKYKTVSAQEMALAILGVDPFTKTKDIPKDREHNVSQLQALLRQNAGEVIGKIMQHNERIDSTVYFAASYEFIDPDYTPRSVIDKCQEIVKEIASAPNWKQNLSKYGGEEIIEYGRSVRKVGRGIYRKEDEKENTDKLIALLIMLLVEKFGGKYGSVKQPAKSEIYRDLTILAEKEGVSLKGIKASSFYDKVKKSFNSLF